MNIFVLFPVWLGLFFCLCASNVSAETSPLKIAKQKWWEASSKNFTIISNTSRKRTLKLLDDLERFRNVVGHFTTARLDENDRPLTVFAVKGLTAYAGLMEGIDSYKSFGGMFFERLEGDYAVIRADNKKYSTGILYHEYTHFLTSLNPNVVIPYWYQEGIAEYLELVTFKSGEVHLGRPNEDHLYWLNNMNWMPIEELLKKKFVKDKKSNEFYQMYSQSWLFVHYLTSDEKRRLQLLKYLEQERLGVGVERAFTTAFGVSFSEMDKTLKNYRRRKGYSFWRLQIEPDYSMDSAIVKKLDASEILVHFGRFLFQAQKLGEKSSKYFALAKEKNSKNAEALAGVAFTSYQEDIENAANLIRESIDLDASNTWVNYVKGKIDKELINVNYSTRYESVPAKEINSVIRAFQVALDGDEYIPALYELSGLYWDMGEPDQALELLEAASSYAPSNMSINERLAQFYVSTGKVVSAYSIIDRMLNKAHIHDKRRKSIRSWSERMMQSVPSRSKSEVLETMQAAKLDLLRSVEEWMNEKDLSELTIEFISTINPDGTLADLELKNTDITDSNVVDSIVGVLKKLDFGTAQVKKQRFGYKFTFALSNVDS